MTEDAISEEWMQIIEDTKAKIRAAFGKGGKVEAALNDAISEEMVEAAAKAVTKLRIKWVNEYMYDTAISEPPAETVASAALAAALPLIVAAERERCAKIAENHRGVNYHNANMAGWRLPSKHEIAAAIRAGKGGE